MKTLIIAVLILILIQTTTWEELESLPIIGFAASNIAHSVVKLDELDGIIKDIDSEPTPWPTATPVIVRQYE